MSKRKKITSVIAAAAIAASIAPGVSAAKSYRIDDNNNKIYEDYIIDRYGNRIEEGYYIDQNGNAIIYGYDYDYDYDYNYSNGNKVNNKGMDPHINIDISDPAAFQRYMNDHMENCDDRYQHYDENGNIINHGAMQYDWEVYNQNQGFNQSLQQPAFSQPEQTSTVLYTVVKTQNGVTKYAYSPVANVAEAYGINGWIVNSIYNENDYELNSVFYEEINTFGNDFRWNYDVRNRIDNAHNLYIWTYPTENGVGYCVSPVKYPQVNGFVYNSDFNMNDVNVELKTAASIIKAPIIDTWARVYAPSIR